MARSRTRKLIGFVNEEGPFYAVPSARLGVARFFWWLAVFLGCCLTIGHNLPRPPQSWTTAKLEDFAQHKDEYDLIILGSSQMYRHVDPEIFDRILAEAGHPLHSFNFGVPGLGALENRWILKQILAMKPAKLKTIVFDAPVPGVLLSGMNHVTPRAKTWHDLDTTMLALRIVRDTGMDTDWKLDMARRHLVSFGYRLCNVGSVRELLDVALHGTQAKRDAAQLDRVTHGPGGLGEGGRGFVSLDEAFTNTTPQQKRFLVERNQAMKKRIDYHVKRLKQNPDRERPMIEYTGEPREVQELWPAEAEVLGDLVSLTQDAGIVPIFTNAPDIRQIEYLITEAADAGIIPTLIDLDDYRRYPDLLNPAIRFDDMHLTKEGARLYTQVLAREVAQLFDQQQGKVEEP